MSLIVMFTWSKKCCKINVYKSRKRTRGTSWMIPPPPMPCTALDTINHVCKDILRNCERVELKKKNLTMLWAAPHSAEPT